MAVLSLDTELDVNKDGTASRQKNRPKIQTWAKESTATYVAALNASSARVRRQAAAALELQHAKEGVPALIAALADSDDTVRVTVIRALGSLGDKHAVKPLLQALATESSDIQAAVIAALSKLNALGKVRDPAATDALIGALNGSKIMRYEAGRALGVIRDPRSVAPLLDALLDEVASNPPASSWADALAVSLGQIGEPALDGLRDLLSRPDSELRRLGAVGLTYIPDSRADAALREALSDEDRAVRDTARWALDARRRSLV